MSTEIGILRNSGSRKKDLFVTRFYGGTDTGTCVQFTSEMEEGGTGYVQLSVRDLEILIPIIQKHIVEYGRSKNDPSFEFDEEIESERKSN